MPLYLMSSSYLPSSQGTYNSPRFCLVRSRNPDSARGRCLLLLARPQVLGFNIEQYLRASVLGTHALVPCKSAWESHLQLSPLGSIQPVHRRNLHLRHGFDTSGELQNNLKATDNQLVDADFCLRHVDFCAEDHGGDCSFIQLCVCLEQMMLLPADSITSHLTYWLSLAEIRSSTTIFGLDEIAIPEGMENAILVKYSQYPRGEILESIRSEEPAVDLTQ
ncbi:hypothetical protein CLAIMM_07090 [Cladophialophora immunda]|nr:hypothetical protein CLAIMM_07090 [Cladophialophora immunda]